MTIHIPRSVVISAAIFCCLAAVGLMVRQAPEFTRYAKIEGM